MMPITTDTPIKPSANTTIGLKLLNSALICAVVEAGGVEGMSIVGIFVF